MSKSDLNHEDNLESSCIQNSSVYDDLDEDNDLLAEEILENINSTPIGRLLKTISFLPEVRQKKILSVRRQISQGRYDLNQHLDTALDRVLEEFIV